MKTSDGRSLETVAQRCMAEFPPKHVWLRDPHAYSMNITEDVRKFAAEQGVSEEEALKRGMEEKSCEFTEKGSELYAKA